MSSQYNHLQKILTSQSMQINYLKHKTPHPRNFYRNFRNRKRKIRERLLKKKKGATLS